MYEETAGKVEARIILESETDGHRDVREKAKFSVCAVRSLRTCSDVVHCLRRLRCSSRIRGRGRRGRGHSVGVRVRVRITEALSHPLTLSQSHA